MRRCTATTAGGAPARQAMRFSAASPYHSRAQTAHGTRPPRVNHSLPGTALSLGMTMLAANRHTVVQICLPRDDATDRSDPVAGSQPAQTTRRRAARGDRIIGRVDGVPPILAADAGFADDVQ